MSSGKRIDDCHGIPVSKAILRRIVFGKWFTGVNSAADENSVETHLSCAQDIGLQPVTYGKDLIARRIAGAM